MFACSETFEQNITTYHLWRMNMLEHFFIRLACAPVSTTQEEWLLINNSDLFHPFHIHISPFFVTEIGQPRDSVRASSPSLANAVSDPFDEAALSGKVGDGEGCLAVVIARAHWPCLIRQQRLTRHSFNRGPNRATQPCRTRT